MQNYLVEILDKKRQFNSQNFGPKPGKMYIIKKNSLTHIDTNYRLFCTWYFRNLYSMKVIRPNKLIKTKKRKNIFAIGESFRYLASTL